MNIRFAFLNLLAALLLAPLAALHAAESLTISAKPTPVAEPEVPPGSGWRGVYFNPQVEGTTDFPWLLHYDAHRELVRRSLFELRKDAGINLVAVQVLIAHSLRVPARGNRVGERVEQWASVAFLDNIARFVDDCHAARIGVELDLADNRWLPSTVDPDAHIGRPGNAPWPPPDATPWDEAAEWYAAVIRHVETRAAHPEAIAL